MTIDAIVILFSSNNPKTKDTFSINNRLVLLDKQVLNLSSSITELNSILCKNHMKLKDYNIALWKQQAPTDNSGQTRKKKKKKVVANNIFLLLL